MRRLQRAFPHLTWKIRSSGPQEPSLQRDEMAGGSAVALLEMQKSGWRWTRATGRNVGSDQYLN